VRKVKNKDLQSLNNNKNEFFSKHILLFVILGISLILSLMSEHFLTMSNFINIARQISINFILAAGLTMVIITGGIDLSVGSIVAFSGVVAGMYLNTGGNFIIAILLALLIGTLCGVINGILVSRFKMASFIATLGMMSMARGLALVLTKGSSITIDNSSYTYIGGGYLFGIPMPVVVAIIIFVLVYLLLNKTRLGRTFFAIGGNEEASRLSGIKVANKHLIVYSISGFLAGLASVVLTARLWAAPPIAGQGFELHAIAASVIGGASLMGGTGTILGTLYGAFIIGIIRNGLNLLGVASFWQQFVIGLIIILAVLFDRIRKNRIE
jgi:ribose transport system permease protein